jgi:hypothetical protein
LSGYDAHFLIRELGSGGVKSNVEVIAQTSETYISFSKKSNGIDLRFLDSFKFMGQSLESLVQILPSEKLHIINSEFNRENISLLTRKGVYPYEYTNSFERLKETSLPDISSFFSKLTGKTISQEDYEHAQRVWRSFDCRNLGEYSDLYLKTDVCLLADVFENFRDTCLFHYALYAAQYYTTPGLAYDAALKMSRVELELITDYDKFLLIESGIRGGSVQCVMRHCEANNSSCKNYDSKQEKSHILYVDSNNLYGHSMVQKLPVGGFKWVDPSMFTEESIMALCDDSDIGYIFQDSMEYPKELHDLHIDLHFCPEFKAPPGKKQKKLLTTLDDKNHYVIHYRSLKQALSHGLKLKKIHRVIQFNQSDWLEGYVIKNTKLRKDAKNDFERTLLKWLVNAVFGKSMERVRDRKIFTIVFNEKQFTKQVNKHNFLDFFQYSENCVG